jgi:hypothetical protein
VNDIVALAANAHSLYFSGVYQKESGLFVVPKSGGKPRKLAALKVLARHLVVDESNAYYAISGGLWRVPLKKKEEAQLVMPAESPAGLVADDTSVYLADGFYLRRLKKP